MFMRQGEHLRQLPTLTLLLLFFHTPIHSAPNRRVTGDPQEQVPLPTWDHYLKQITSVTINDENAAFRDFMHKLNEVDRVGDWEEEWANRVADAFEKLISENSKRHLNEIKKKEVSAIRRRLMQGKKNQNQNNSELPTHLDMTNPRFTGQDLRMLIMANSNHVKKFTELRERDFQRYEMEKRFLEEQRLRHIKDDEQRKAEQERLEAVKAGQANRKIKHPLTEDTAKEVWEEKEQLPKDEFNPKTFFALNDLDSNGLLDMEEVRRLLHKELENSYDKGSQPDEREKREEMERMREHIYNEIDRNRDMMIDYSEFAQGLEDKKDIDKNWETIDNEPVFDDKDFNTYEKKRIDEIREDIAEGKKPEGYEFRDVPLLDDNFLNETHIRFGGELFHADDTPALIRKQMAKEFYMKEKFREEQVLAHLENPAERARIEKEMEAARVAMIRIHLPLSPKQLQAVWKEQDHLEEADFTPEKFFHLHDIDMSGAIDKQELRLMLITELRDAYRNANKSSSAPDFSLQLESMKDEVFNKTDRNKDGLIDFEEFKTHVDENQKKYQQNDDDDEQLYRLHEETEFTEEEFQQYKNEKIREIRKMIADGVLSENYNYNDVPLLTGNFINSTHVMRNGSIMNIHELSNHREQRVRDFKRSRLEARYRFEERIKHLSPEQKEMERKRASDAAKERRRLRHEDAKKRHKAAKLPMSEDQEREVWEKEDEMEKKDFDLEHYFRLHDVDKSGRWNRQEIAASLMSNLEATVPSNDSDPTVAQKREHTMEKWMRYIFKHGDLDGDGQLDFKEAEHLAKMNKEKASNSKEEEELWESLERDDDEDEEYDEAEYE